MSSKSWTELLDTAEARYNDASAVIKQERANLQQSKERYEACMEAQKELQALVQAIQLATHSHVGSLVTRCLAAVFPENYEFHIKFTQSRNKTEAHFVFKRGDLEVDPLTASGGGVVDVASFALRLAALLYTNPPGRRLLVLDEPFKFLSRGHLERLRDLIEALAEEMNVQFLMVTHIPELHIGKVVQIPNKAERKD